MVETAPVLPPRPRPPPPPQPQPTPEPQIDTDTASNFQKTQNLLSKFFGGGGVGRIPPKSDGAPQGAYVKDENGKFVSIKK